MGVGGYQHLQSKSAQSASVCVCVCTRVCLHVGNCECDGVVFQYKFHFALFD